MFFLEPRVSLRDLTSDRWPSPRWLHPVHNSSYSWGGKPLDEWGAHSMCCQDATHKHRTCHGGFSCRSKYHQQPRPATPACATDRQLLGDCQKLSKYALILMGIRRGVPPANMGDICGKPLAARTRLKPFSHPRQFRTAD